MATPGRPTVIDENALRILEDAFTVGATDEMACFLAKVSTTSFYEYQKRNPEYQERKATLKNMTKYKAKKVVAKELDEGDKATALWLLERKGKDEGYSVRQEMTGADGGPIEIDLTPEQKKKIAERVLKQ